MRDIMSENKYMINEENNEKREMRRKKRKRARALAWTFLLIFVALIVALGVFVTMTLLDNKKTADTPATETSVSVSTEENVTDVSDELSNVLENLNNEDEIIVKEPEVIEPTEEEMFREAVAEYVSLLPVEDKVAGIFIVTPESITGVDTVVRAGDGTKAALEKYPVGGLVYDTKNIQSAEQFKSMLANTVSFAKHPLFLAVNEEPGNTVVAKALKYDKTQSASEIGATLDPQGAYDAFAYISGYLKDLGINLNLGLTCDLIVNSENNTLGNRVFGLDAVINGQMVSRAVEANETAGMHIALKHFPGEATGTQNTTAGVATSFRTKAEIDSAETTVFLNGVEAGADAIIVSHVAVPEITGDNMPCSMSKVLMTDYIRVEQQLDDIIIITDDMTKAAISEYYDSADSSIAAIKAGADMVMKPANFTEAYDAVLNAVQNGIIAEQRINDSLTRIYMTKFAGMTSDEVKLLSVPTEE